MTCADAVLDHLALAVFFVDDVRDTVERRWRLPAADGGDTSDFTFAQWGFANGMKLEALEPRGGDPRSFLRRFLSSNGPGPHHLTFKVTDLDEAMAAAEDADFPILYARKDNDDWQEAFIHPRHASGTVIQLAQSSHPKPTLVVQQGVSLTMVVLLVADVSAAQRLYAAVLGGTVTEPDPSLGLPPGTLLLGWPQRASLALVPTDPDRLGGATGRVGRVVLEASAGHDREGTLPGLTLSWREPTAVPAVG